MIPVAGPNPEIRRVVVTAPLALALGALFGRPALAAGPVANAQTGGGQAPAAADSTSAGQGGNGLPQVQRRSVAVRERTAPPLPEAGTRLSPPPITMLDGSRFDASTAKGVLIVYWWASTCPFCAVQSPYMQAFWEAHRDKGLSMLALSIDKTPKAAVDYLNRKHLSFPAAWADDAFLDAFPKPKGLPITIVRGADGRVLQAERGQLFPEDVEEMARWL